MVYVTALNLTNLKSRVHKWGQSGIAPIVRTVG